MNEFWDWCRPVFAFAALLFVALVMAGVFDWGARRLVRLVRGTKPSAPDRKPSLSDFINQVELVGGPQDGTLVTVLGEPDLLVAESEYQPAMQYLRTKEKNEDGLPRYYLSSMVKS